MLAWLGIAGVLAVIIVCCGAAGAGPHQLVGAPDPVVAALRNRPSFRGHGDWLLLAVNIAAVAALIAGFFGGVFASSRMFFHLAREGAMPAVLTRTNSRQAPWIAVLVASISSAIFTEILTS